MATKVVLAVAVTLLVMLVVASGQAQCPGVASFAPCVQYVNSPNAASPPKGGACCQLVMTLSSDCLCKAASNPNPITGVTVDFKKAITLPKACGRSVPPHTTCNGTPVPGRR